MEPFLPQKLESHVKPDDDKEPCKWKQKYKDDKALYIQYIYLLGVIVWGIIIVIFALYCTDIIGWIILLLPFVVFFFGYINATEVTLDIEEEIFQSDYLSVGLLIILPLLTWMNRDYTGDNSRFTTIIVLAIIITLFSLIDIWVNRDWLSVERHIKSVLQTFSIVLLIYALYMFYVKMPHLIAKDKE
jgi:hypothetical protein